MAKQRGKPAQKKVQAVDRPITAGLKGGKREVAKGCAHACRHAARARYCCRCRKIAPEDLCLLCRAR
jgi:hypothetical protein